MEIDDYDSDDEQLDDANPLHEIRVDSKQREAFRKEMEDKQKFLERKRHELRQELTHNRDIQMQQPFKNPTTIEHRTFNDPRSGVVSCIVPHGQPDRPRATFYKCANSEGHVLQSIDERNAEYDLMAYPLFYPEGSHLKFGWTDNVCKVLDKHSLVESHFRLIKKYFPEDEMKKIKTRRQKVNFLKKY